jgi:hypothetical protein
MQVVVDSLHLVYECGKGGGEVLRFRARRRLHGSRKGEEVVYLPL